MNDIGIYLIINLQNFKTYVGQTKDFLVRKRSHWNQLRKHKGSPHLQAAWNKYGAQNFVFVPIEFCSLEELDVRERFWIVVLDSTNKRTGYNIEGFPRGTGKRSAETIQKLISGHAKYWKGKKFSPEHKKKISVALDGKSRPPRSAQHIQNLILAQNERWTGTARLARSESQRRKWEDPEYRLRLQNAHRGKRKAVEEHQDGGN